MKISNVELIRATLPFHAPFRFALAETSSSTNVFVRITTESGLVGLGEASPSPAITGDTADTMMAAGRTLGSMLLGKDATDLEGAFRQMRARLNGHPTIRGGFDIALHDLAAQAANMPLFRFLGGGRRAFETDNTVGIANPDEMAEAAVRFVGEGYRAIKMKVGTDAAVDILRIRAIRAAVGGGIPLRIDANQGWDVSSAIRVLHEVEECGIEYCEQPVRRGDVAGMRRVRDQTRIPIMADESVFDHFDALALARADACDHLNIKLSKSAGIRGALRIAAVAEAAGMSCMVGCMSETRLGLTAAAHFVSARPVVRYADLDSHVDHTIDPVTGGITIAGGVVTVPDSPGLGAGLTEEFVDGCHVERVEA